MDNNEFGTLLKNLRKQKSMTQEKLATLLNVSTSAVCKWERGNNLPDISMFQKIAEIFEVSIEDLLNPSKSMSHSSSAHTAANIPAKQANTLAKDICNETSQTVTTNKQITYRPWRIITTVFALLLLLTIGIGIYVYCSKNSSPNIYPYTYRITEDEYVGTVFEKAFVYEGKFSESKLSDSFLQAIADNWKENNNISADIKILKVSFYSSEELATQWVLPLYSTYFKR